MFFEKIIRKIFGTRRVAGTYVGRSRTKDAIFTFRMGAGFVGDITRRNPTPDIEACQISVSAPPTAYGQLVYVNTDGVSPAVTAGNIQVAYGITVRPFPQQAATSPQQFGGTGALGTSGAPPTTGIIDVLRSGYVNVITNSVVAANGTMKGVPVYAWNTTASGAHVPGGFEALSTSATQVGVPATGGLPTVTFNGIPDANGITEIAFNV